MFQFLQPDVPSVSAKQVMDAIKNGEQCTLVDVRTEGEFKRGHIKNSMHIPQNAVSDTLEQRIPDKKSKIYVYCLSGSRSVFAVSDMVKMGYTNVFDMKNGLLAWRAEHFDIEV